MKKLISFVILLLSGMSFFANADPTPTHDPNPLGKYLAGTVSGDFTLISNYLFRGISLSNNNPAAQGGFTYTLTQSGIYFNLWGSNVDFKDNQSKHATVELDTIMGISNPVNDHLSYDIHIDRYNYPKASGANYNEVIATAIYRWLHGTLGYSSNVYNVHQTGTYYELGFDIDLPARIIYFEGLTFATAAGHHSLPRSAGLNSYNNYSITLSKTIKNYILALQWTGTDGRANQSPNDGNHVVASVTVHF